MNIVHVLLSPFVFLVVAHVPLKDSRNGMIWLYDMASATCTSALSCHSQQARLQIVSTGRWQKEQPAVDLMVDKLIHIPYLWTHIYICIYIYIYLFVYIYIYTFLIYNTYIFIYRVYKHYSPLNLMGSSLHVVAIDIYR